MFPYSKSSVHHDLYLYGLYVCHLMHKNCQDPPALKNMQIQGTTRILVFGSCSYCSMPGTGQLGQGGFSHRNWFLKRPTNMGFRWNQCRLSEDLAWGYDDYWRAMLSAYLFQLELDPLILYRQRPFAWHMYLWYCKGMLWCRYHTVSSSHVIPPAVMAIYQLQVLLTPFIECIIPFITTYNWFLWP